MLHEQLTENDVKKIKEEIEYRKLTVRKNAIEAVKEARAHLLLHGFRQEILMWQGQVLCYDLCLCDACTGITIA